MKMYGLMLAGLLAGIILASFAAVQAAPQGPDQINITSSQRNSQSSSALLVQAEAGNVTSLKISGLRITQTWQAYYGNISGAIVLDDANNFTFYDWALPNPTGEIYAANGSNVNWANVYCINVSQNGSQPIRPDGTVTNINASTIELKYGINISDTDGLNETFTSFYTDADGFYVGAINFNINDGCSMLQPYTNELPSSSWQELLLSDNQSIIFSTIIRNNDNGFQPGSTDIMDFQLMVLENGHFGSESTTTNYYFYVELS